MQRSQIAFNFRTACRQIVSLCILNYSWSWRRNLCGSRTSPWVSGQLYADLKMVLVTSHVCIKNIFSSLHVRTYQQTLTFHRIYRRCIWRMHDWISHLISGLFLNYHRSSSTNKVRTQDIFFIEQWIYPKKYYVLNGRGTSFNHFLVYIKVSNIRYSEQSQGWLPLILCHITTNYCAIAYLWSRLAQLNFTS